MIGVEGQYLVQFQIGEYVDFINERDLILFKLIEEAGNVLPQFELRFNLADSKILTQINEGQVIKVAFGRNFIESINIELIPTKKTIIQSGSYYLVNIIGLFNILPYLMETKCTISEEISGIEQIISIMEDYSLLIDTNIDASLDSQRWIQPSITDHNFVNQIWLHCDLEDSFPMIGITSNGIFRIRSLKEMLVGGGYDWVFAYGTTSESTATNILYNYDAVVESETGFHNMWSGYDRTKTVYNLVTGETEITQPSINSSFITSQLDRLAITTRSVEAGAINENVHSNYWKSYLDNLSNLVRFSSTVVKLTFDHFYYPIKILDLAMFREPDLNNVVSIETYSGLYIVSKITRTISSKKLNTAVTLTREALNFPGSI